MKQRDGMKNDISEIKGAYDRAAPLYDFMNQLFFFGKDAKLRSMVVEYLNLKPDDTVLNSCCGTGSDFPYISRKLGSKGTVVGVDISVKMLHQAKKKREQDDVNLVRADIAHLPFRDKIYDAIVLSFCLKITPTYSESIRETARVLQSNGTIAVLANYKRPGIVGSVITTVIGGMAKINYAVDLEASLSKKFEIVKNILLYGSLVQLLIGEKRSRVN